MAKKKEVAELERMEEFAETVKELDTQRTIAIRRINPGVAPDSPEAKEGMIFLLDKNGNLKEDMVDAMIVKVDAATLPDNRTTVVSVLLRNRFIINDTHTCLNEEDYDINKAVDECMVGIREEIKSYLEFMFCCASVNVNELIELDNIAEEQAKAIAEESTPLS